MFHKHISVFFNVKKLYFAFYHKMGVSLWGKMHFDLVELGLKTYV